MISIALIDDHPLAINGIGAWLSSTGRFTIAGTARTLAEGRDLLQKLDPLPAIIILDVALGAEDGLDFIPVLKEICNERKAAIQETFGGGIKVPGVLVCSMYEDPFLIQRVMDSGAQGYVAKSAEFTEIINAIDSILGGKNYVDPRYCMNTKKRSWSVLTLRENEIAALVKQSLTTRQIAKRLGISVRTVENHLTHIYVKTDAASRAELIDL